MILGRCARSVIARRWRRFARGQLTGHEPPGVFPPACVARELLESLAAGRTALQVLFQIGLLIVRQMIFQEESQPRRIENATIGHHRSPPASIAGSPSTCMI